MTALRVGVAAMIALALAACDTGSCERSGLDCPVEPGTRTVVAGVDLDSLFARPTGAEIATVLADWRTGPDPDSAVVLREVTTLDLGGRETVRVIEGIRSSTEASIFVGAIRQPPRLPGDVTQRPVLLVLGDGPDADIETLISDLALADPLKNEVVMVFLAYRGGALQVNGQSYRADASADPYQADGEDAWSLITGLHALDGDVAIDPDRVAIIGHGRGGTVALLHAVRATARARGVPRYILSLAAPASFFTPNSRLAARLILEDRSPGQLPAIGPVMRATAGTVRDGDVTIEEARLGLLRRSPAFFFVPPRLPPPPVVFAAYATDDIIVPIEDGRALDFLTGETERGLYLEVDGATHASVQRDPQVLGTGRVLLCELLLDNVPTDCR